MTNSPLTTESAPETTSCRPLAPFAIPRLERAILILCLALAALIAFGHRYTMNPDALSYLEVGESWWRGDFANAIVGYWSPLFPILQAGAAKLAPSRAFETIPLHALQLVILAATFFAFRSFLRELDSPIRDEQARFAFRLSAWTIFIWSAFCVNDIAEALPDLFLSIWVLLAARCILRLEQPGFGASVGLGLSLALGYLTKPVMFPLGFIALAICAFFPKPSRRKFGRIAVASLVFVILAALYVLPLSLQKGRFTFSDSGTLAYAWEVNGFSPYIHWQGQPSGSGTPKHTTRQILDFPPTFEFDRGRPGTYPLWYDASYWNDGLHARPVLRDQARRLSQSALFYSRFLFTDPVVAVLLFSIILVAASVGLKNLWTLSQLFLPLFLLTIAACGLYALVFVIPRYFAPFAMITGACWSAIACRSGAASGAVLVRWARSGALLGAIYVVGICAFSIAFGLFGKKATSYVTHRQVAAALEAGGLRPGDKVAVIGRGCDPYFARIGGFRIVSEAPVLGGHPTWPASAENFTRIAQAVRTGTSAKAIIADVVPNEPLKEWQEVPGTGYRILILQQ